VLWPCLLPLVGLVSPWHWFLKLLEGKLEYTQVSHREVSKTSAKAIRDQQAAKDKARATWDASPEYTQVSPREVLKTSAKVIQDQQAAKDKATTRDGPEYTQVSPREVLKTGYSPNRAKAEAIKDDNSSGSSTQESGAISGDDEHQHRQPRPPRPTFPGAFAVGGGMSDYSSDNNENNQSKSSDEDPAPLFEAEVVDMDSEMRRLEEHNQLLRDQHQVDQMLRNAPVAQVLDRESLINATFVEPPNNVKLPIKTELVVTDTATTHGTSTHHTNDGSLFGKTSTGQYHGRTKSQSRTKTVLKVRTKGIKDTSADSFYKLVEQTFLQAYFEGSSGAELEDWTLDSMDKVYIHQFQSCPLLGCRILACMVCLITCVEKPSKFKKAKKMLEHYCEKAIQDEKNGDIMDTVPEKVSLPVPQLFRITCGTACCAGHRVGDIDTYNLTEEILLIRFIQLYKLRDNRVNLYLREMPNALKLVEEFQMSSSQCI